MQKLIILSTKFFYMYLKKQTKQFLCVLGLMMGPFAAVAQFQQPDDPSDQETQEQVSNTISTLDNTTAPRGGELFAYSITLNGNDIYRFMNASNCNTVALYHGYSMADNFNNANKVLIVVPVTSRYQTKSGADCLMYSYGNMKFSNESYASSVTTARSSAELPLISAALAKQYIDHFNDNQNRDEVRGILLSRSTLDKVIRNNSNSVMYNMRINYGIDDNGQRMVVVSSVDAASGMAARNANMQVLSGSSLCPNNCDVY